MKLRCLTTVAFLGMLLAFGSGMTAAHAASMSPNSSSSTATATYRLTSSSGLPVPDTSIQAPQVVALISPAGGVVPPKQADGTEGSPLTVLPDSKGFDPNHLIVLLLDDKSATGEPVQKFGLLFDGQGLQPDGVLHFALSIDKALADKPPVLVSQTAGISIVRDLPTTPPTTTETNGTNGGGTLDGNQIPEPLSLVFWSVAAFGVATRHRRSRRWQQSA